ncbi:MAG TPA: methylated-DNA--[protein]-cysteine S-methyltransferase [Pseudonocardiaceae bacterium]|jgi:methylated-DNA-[protein]-cysteine S-methyltransferase
MHIVIDSPVGPLTLVAAGPALCGLYLEQRRHPPRECYGEDATDDVTLDVTSSRALLAEAASQLGRYFAGRLTEFDLPLAPEGTPFQRSVWQALRAIPYGETVTYGELAERLGRPGAARAVGAANGRNPISIVVPCHRVIGSSGHLTGYGGGIEQKRQLLALERRVTDGGRTQREDVCSERDPVRNSNGHVR